MNARILPLAAAILLVRASMSQYCIPGFDITNVSDNFYIYHVSLIQLDHTSSGPSSPVYEDFTAVTPVAYLVRGSSYTLTVQVEANSTGDTDLNAWVDFNQNGVLGTSTERVMELEVSSAISTYTSVVSVPADAELGPTRLRVLLTFLGGSTVNPCDQFNDAGQCEDYRVMIVDAPVSLPPVADFSSSTSSLPPGGGFVSFTEQCTMSPYAFSWTFEGGTPATSTLPDPVNIYFSSPGCHQVTLTATNNHGSDPEVRVCEVNVEAITQPPIADFTSSVTTLPIGGGTVDFFDQSTQNPGTYSWSFVGGTPPTSTAQNPTGILFTEPGCHEVTLTVTNIIGQDTEARSCQVEVEAPLVDCVDLFISEYVEGSANSKAIELHNPTDGVIDLSGYRLMLFANGATISNSYIDLTGTLQPNGTLVIANPGSSAELLAIADLTNAVCGFNGDDAVALRKNNVDVDVVGIVGVDPGSSWPVASGSTANRSLVRKFQVTNGETDWTISAQEWNVYSEDDFSHLGAHSGICHTSTAIGSSSSASVLRVHPVPADDALFIERGMDASKNVLYEVLNAQGSVVLRAGASGTVHSLIIASLAPGHYLLRAVAQGEASRMARFSVMR